MWGLSFFGVVLDEGVNVCNEVVILVLVSVVWVVVELMNEEWVVVC